MGVRKITVMILVFLLLLVCSSVFVRGSIQIWPGKLTITMAEGYPKEAIKYKIQVTNPYSYDVNASARVENPAIEKLSDGYTFIPNLSWVSTTPEILHIPAHESRFLEAIITIPDDEKPRHYNESWETWVVISSDRGSGSSGGFFFQIELAVKFFINTPPEKARQQIPQTLYLILLFIIVGLIAAATFVFYAKKRERITHKKRPAILYFKKKKGGSSRNNRP